MDVCPDVKPLLDIVQHSKYHSKNGGDVTPLYLSMIAELASKFQSVQSQEEAGATRIDWNQWWSERAIKRQTTAHAADKVSHAEHDDEREAYLARGREGKGRFRQVRRDPHRAGGLRAAAAKCPGAV